MIDRERDDDDDPLCRVTRVRQQPLTHWSMPTQHRGGSGRVYIFPPSVRFSPPRFSCYPCFNPFPPTSATSSGAFSPPTVLFQTRPLLAAAGQWLPPPPPPPLPWLLSPCGVRRRSSSFFSSRISAFFFAGDRGGAFNFEECAFWSKLRCPHHKVTSPFTARSFKLGALIRFATLHRVLLIRAYDWANFARARAVFVLVLLDSESRLEIGFRGGETGCEHAKHWDGCRESTVLRRIVRYERCSELVT